MGPLLEKGQVDAGPAADDDQHGAALPEGFGSVIDGGQGGTAGRLDENSMVVGEAQTGADGGPVRNDPGCDGVFSGP